MFRENNDNESNGESYGELSPVHKIPEDSDILIEEEEVVVEQQDECNPKDSAIISSEAISKGKIFYQNLKNLSKEVSTIKEILSTFDDFLKTPSMYITSNFEYREIATEPTKHIHLKNGYCTLYLNTDDLKWAIYIQSLSNHRWGNQIKLNSLQPTITLGTKLHLSIFLDHLPKAWNIINDILISFNVHKAKVMIEKYQSEFAQTIINTDNISAIDTNTARRIGTEITIYEDQFTEAEAKEFVEAITATFIKNYIAPSETPLITAGEIKLSEIDENFFTSLDKDKCWCEYTALSPFVYVGNEMRGIDRKLQSKPILLNPFRNAKANLTPEQIEILKNVIQERNKNQLAINTKLISSNHNVYRFDDNFDLIRTEPILEIGATSTKTDFFSMFSSKQCHSNDQSVMSALEKCKNARAIKQKIIDTNFKISDVLGEQIDQDISKSINLVSNYLTLLNSIKTPVANEVETLRFFVDAILLNICFDERVINAYQIKHKAGKQTGEFSLPESISIASWNSNVKNDFLGGEAGKQITEKQDENQQNKIVEILPQSAYNSNAVTVLNDEVKRILPKPKLDEPEPICKCCF